MLRFYVLGSLVFLGAVAVLAAAIGGPGWWLFLAVVVALLAVGVHDVVQTKHSILRNFPVIGHVRYLMEGIRPELQQYFIERNDDGRPYDRITRTSIYQRAKGAADAAVRDRDLDWTIVRPGGLVDDEPTGAVAVAASTGRGMIPRADVAEVIAVLLDQGLAVRRQFEVISGPDPIAGALQQL